MQPKAPKQARRGRPATGSIEWRNGWAWARLTVTIDGEKVRKLFALETQDRIVAKRKLARLAKAAAQGAVVEPKAIAAAAKRVETYAEAAERIRKQRRREGLRDVDNEEGRDRLYLLPVIGELEVTAIRPYHIREVLEEARDAGKSVKTLTHIRAAANIVFDALWREETIPENPCLRVPKVKGKTDRRERAVLTDEELAIYVAWEHPDERWGAGVIQRQVMSIMSRTFGGVRAGDLHALRWEALDTANGRFEFGVAPRKKTERPQMLAIAPVLRPYIRRWWELMGEPAEGLMFPHLIGSGAGTDAKTGVSHAKALRRDLMRAFGLEALEHGEWVTKVSPEDYNPRHRELFEHTTQTKPVDFHSFRRAFSQALADADVNAQQAAALAGHSSLDAHMRYLANTSRAREMPEKAVPSLRVISPQQSDDKAPDGAKKAAPKSDLFPNDSEWLRGLDLNQRPSGYESENLVKSPRFLQNGDSAPIGISAVNAPLVAQTVVDIPARPITLGDVLSAAKRANLDGDQHAVHRLLAEALSRCEASPAARADREGGDRGTR